MKKIYYSLVMFSLTLATVSCTSVGYKKTKTGMLYKIISSSKDSVVKEGEWMKVYFTQKLNDSILQSNYGKMPVYIKQQAANPSNVYNPGEIFNLLRKGDSVVTVMITDSLISKKLTPQLPPFMKKGDRIVTSLRVVQVFKNDSIYQKDYVVEMEKDRPRQEKEQKEEEAKATKERLDQRKKQELEAEKSGEMSKELKDMESYLSSRHIQAQKVGTGTYVSIKQQGAGPQAASGKFVTVKYTGKRLATDSAFQSSTYTFQLGQASVVGGWDEGLTAFKQGGNGTLYIPGFKAYGKNPPPGSPFKPDEPLVFDVEMLNVADTMPAQQAPPQMPERRN